MGSLFRERARLHPERPAVEAVGGSLTYGQLNERVNRAANILRGFGIVAHAQSRLAYCGVDAMALKATIFKADVRIADVDRGYYQDHALTIARHPSETDERMMVRVIAFALHAHDALAFGKGLGADDEPDLWQKDLTGAIELWIDVGQPDERRVRRACGRAARVFVYAYGGHAVDSWWEKAAAGLERITNLTVMKLSPSGSQAAAGLVQRTMQLQCTIQDGQVWMGDMDRTVQVDLTLMSGRARTRRAG